METYGGVDVFIPYFLDFGTSWMSGQLEALAALPWGKEPLVPII
jgi:hypothetical protein